MKKKYIYVCSNCNKQFRAKRKKTKNKNNLYYCSLKCSCKKANLKRLTSIYHCKICNEIVPARINYCVKHNPKIFKDWNKVYLKDITHAQLRELARKTYNRSDKPKYCINCNYSKHYECCHIKDVSQFTDETPIGIVNNIDNLIALCGNCHYEFDNDLLSLNDIEWNHVNNLYCTNY
jgi:hypothetical protein